MTVARGPFFLCVLGRGRRRAEEGDDAIPLIEPEILGHGTGSSRSKVDRCIVVLSVGGTGARQFEGLVRLHVGAIVADRIALYSSSGPPCSTAYRNTE
jgi:hypothetical protein